MIMKIDSKATLDEAISALEHKRKFQEEDLVAHFKVTKESLSPMNLLKSGIGKLGEMPDIGQGILKTIGGLGMGILSKRLFLGSSPGIIKKLLGPVFEFAVAKSTINNADKFKALGLSIYNNLFKKSKKQKHLS